MVLHLRTTYEIRYSRWDDERQPVRLLRQPPQRPRRRLTGPWSGEPAGRQWLDVDTREDEPNKYRWVAAYENWPYDVTVKGVDEAARDEGMAQVDRDPAGRRSASSTDQ